MLSWDIGPLYTQFVDLDVAAMAACPLGALLLMVAHAVSRTNRGAEELPRLPSFAWAEEMFSLLLLGPGAGPDTLEQWAASGWNPFLMLSNLRYHVHLTVGHSAPGCLPDGGEAFLPHAVKMVTAGSPVPLPEIAAFLAAVDGGSCAVTGPEPAEDRPCCLARSMGLLALADAAAVSGREGHRELLGQALSALQAGARTAGRPLGALHVLVHSRWPIVDAMDKLFQLPQVELRIADVVRRVLRQEPEGSLATPAALARSFYLRLFPVREIVSDNVRFSRTPFCGMRPFMKLVERVAAAAGPAPCSEGRRCVLDFVEGGPHLGDCTLWAAAALEAAGLEHFAAAYEPLPDASALFRESVLANRWEGRVVVVPRALAARDGDTVTLAYFPGHNGEGTTVRAGMDPHCGALCTGYHEIPTASLDGSWPALRPAPLELLKLSVNGEELNTLRGARRLLTSRRVCSVMVHVTKAQRGWADVPRRKAHGAEIAAAAQGGDASAVSEVHDFSRELWELLSELGGLEVSLHLDTDAHGQVPGDPRPRPSTRRLRSAAQLDDVFAAEAYPPDYLVARQPEAGEGEPCAGSLALRHWHQVFP